MARGDARRRAGKVGQEDDDSPRTYCGRYTVSGDEENGLRVVMPMAPAKGAGIEPGDEVDVEHDPRRDELVYSKVE